VRQDAALQEGVELVFGELRQAGASGLIRTWEELLAGRCAFEHQQSCHLETAF